MKNKNIYIFRNFPSQNVVLNCKYEIKENTPKCLYSLQFSKNMEHKEIFCVTLFRYNSTHQHKNGAIGRLRHYSNHVLTINEPGVL